MTVWYDGLTTPTDFATGFPIHEEDTETKTFVRSYAEWQIRIKDYLDALKTPLQVEVKQKLRILLFYLTRKY